MVITFVGQRGGTRTDLVSEDGTGIIVAVLDTGVSDLHPLIAGKLIKKLDFTNSHPEDLQGHGTACSSIILNQAPNARIISCKVLGDGGNGLESGIMLGIEAAVSEGATILNMSLGGVRQGCPEDSLYALFIDQIVQDSGVMIIAAAGNAGPGNNPLMPAASRSVVAVGAINIELIPADFSSRGPSCNKIYPDVASYGVDQEAATINGGTRNNFGGTSGATPMIVGQMALVTQRIGRTLTIEQMEYVFEHACTRIGSADKNNVTGWGFLDTPDALIAAQEIVGIPIPITGIIQGNVSDASTGDPIANAAVSFRDSVTYTNINGFYTMEVEAGLGIIRSFKSNYDIFQQGIILNIGETLQIDVSLIPEITTPDSTLSGYVRDESTNQPINGVRVQFMGIVTTTSTNGFYSIQTQAGIGLLQVEKDGYIDKGIAVVLQEGENKVVNVFLRSESQPPIEVAYITGRVIDSNTSAPIEGVVVTFNESSTITDSIGVYSLQTMPGSGIISFMKDDYIIEQRTIQVNQDETIIVDVDLRVDIPPPPPPPDEKNIVVPVLLGGILAMSLFSIAKKK